MRISPSIASFDSLSFSAEVTFIDKYFNDIHLDIEDGMAVDNITFGLKTAKAIALKTTSRISFHLEVMEPWNLIDEVKECRPEIVFIQADILKDPKEVLIQFQKAGLEVGLAIGDRDRTRNYDDCLALTRHLLVNTAFHDDPKQLYQPIMQDFALYWANRGKKVWLDGGVDFKTVQKLSNSPIYAVIMGRAIYRNKAKIAAYSAEKGERDELDFRDFS